MRGGKRPGAGRKRVAGELRRIRFGVLLTPEDMRKLTYLVDRFQEQNKKASRSTVLAHACRELFDIVFGDKV